ncbi:MAG: hypothetical protein ABR575_10565 [Actinomycetota bacterium]
MRRRALPAVVALVAALGLVPMLASANHAEVLDPDDATGFLDVARVGVTGDPMQPRWAIETFGEWSAERLWDRGWLFIYFDTFGSARPDYYALLRSNGKRITGVLRRDRPEKSDYTIAGLDPTRPHRAAVAVRVPLARMRFGDVRAEYRWHVETVLINRRCRRVCFDQAPDGEAMVEPRPGASPSPTVTIPSISPSPSPPA